MIVVGGNHHDGKKFLKWILKFECKNNFCTSTILDAELTTARALGILFYVQLECEK